MQGGQVVVFGVQETDVFRRKYKNFLIQVFYSLGHQNTFIAKYHRQGVFMTKIHKATIIGVSLIVLILIGKLIKVSFFEDKTFEVIGNSIATLFYTKPITEYQKILLNSTMDEQLYAKGYPDFVFDIKRNSIPSEEIEKNPLRHKAYYLWTYANKDGSVTSIEFDESKKVKEIMCYGGEVYGKTDSFAAFTRCRINNLFLDSTEEDLFQILGKPSSEKIHDTTKIVEYKNLNLRVHLSKLKITAFIVKSQFR